MSKNYSAKIDEAKQGLTDLLARLSEAAIGCQRDENLADPFTSVAHLTSIMGEIADSACRLEHFALDAPHLSLVEKVVQPNPYATIYGKKWNYRFNRAGEVIAMQAKSVLEDLSGNSKAEWETIAPSDRFVLPEKLVIPIQVPDEVFPDLGYRFIVCKQGCHDPLENIWHLIEMGKDEDEYLTNILHHLMTELKGDTQSHGTCFADPVTGKLLMVVDHTVTE